MILTNNIFSSCEIVDNYEHLPQSLRGTISTTSCYYKIIFGLRQDLRILQFSSSRTSAISGVSQMKTYKNSYCTKIFIIKFLDDQVSKKDDMGYNNRS